MGGGRSRPGRRLRPEGPRNHRPHVDCKRRPGLGPPPPSGGGLPAQLCGILLWVLPGTHLRQLFPDKVRALLVDGVLDPIAWSTGTDETRSLPFSTRLHSEHGAYATLRQFFSLCNEGGTNCPVSLVPTATTPRAWKLGPRPHAPRTESSPIRPAVDVVLKHL